jgi:hypothetical protein
VHSWHGSSFLIWTDTLMFVRDSFLRLTVAIAAAVVIEIGMAGSARSAETQFLLFQLASSFPAVAGRPAGTPAKADIEKEVDDVLNTIGTHGDHLHRQLGFTIGPLMFDLTDEQLRTYIRDAFQVAEDKDVAVAFHIDDSMFWNNRKDLWSLNGNVEWSDWNGTAVPHRIIGWVLDGRAVLAPPICYNSRAIVAETQRLAGAVIGAEIKKNSDHLAAIGKPYLFAGIIAGWETRMQDDSQPPVFYGYCSLHNLGYTASHLPTDIDLALAGVVHDWVEVWAKTLRDSGIQRDRIFTHNGSPRADPPQGVPNPIRNFFKDAPPSITAFTDYSYPGFTGGAGNPDGYTQIYKLLSEKNYPPWGISEGTGVVSSSNPFSNFVSGSTDNTAAGRIMEGYLAGAMNHGAIYVNMFAWSHRDDPLSRATTAKSSIEVYRKFLEGKPLQDSKTTTTPSPASGGSGESLYEKMQVIQKEASPWMQQHPDQQPQVTSLLQRLDQLLKANRGDQADQIADQVLNLIGK